MGVKMDQIAGKGTSGHRKILLPLNDSPESKAALVWAVQNLIRQEDQVLLYHMVKTPTLIPTAMGMVPYSGASPAMQKAHILVATEDGTKLLRSLQAYCKTKKIDVAIEVGRCDKRQVELLRKANEEAVSLLIMGTGGSSMFGLRLGKKPTLSARVCQDAECHVILVDRKKRPTVHAKTPSPKCVDKPVVTSNALPSPQSASESLDEVSKQSSVPLSSEPEGENADSRERIPPQETLGAITEQVPVALPTEPRGGSSNGPERVSPQGGGLPASRGKLSVEVPTEIVLGELATPDADIGPDAKCAHAAILLPKSTSDGTLNPTPSPVSKASSYTSLPITKPSNAARAQTNDFRTWSQTLQLFPLPESDAEGGTDTDADAESDAKGDGNGKVGKTGKKGGEGDGTGKTDEKRGRIGKRGGIWKTDGKVDANSGGGADADADGEEYADALADVVSDAASSPPGRTGGPDSDSPVGVARPGETSPGEKGKRLGLKTPFGATKEAVGGQLPSPKSATARHATPPGLPRSPVSSPTGRNQPVPSAKALINRVFLALNENNSAGSPAHDPTSAIRHRSPARLPSPRGIPPRKRVPSDGSRDTPVFDVPSIWTLMKPRAEAAPVFGEFDTNLSNDRQTSLQGSSEGLLPDGPRLSADKAPDSRRSSSRRSLDVPLSDGHRTSVGHSSDAHQMNAGQFSDGRWTAAGESLNSRRTSAGQSSDSRRAVREPAPDRRRKSFGLSPDGSRTFNGAPTPSESPSGAQTEAMIAQLREQVDLLTQIGNLRDREFENVASRAKEAEKAAKERERALLSEQLLREEAELKARRLADQMAALRVRASRANSGADRTRPPPHQ